MVIKMSKCLHDVGFQSSNSNVSMLAYNKQNDMIIFLEYVDDIIVTSDNIALIQEVLDKLNTKNLHSRNWEIYLSF